MKNIESALNTADELIYDAGQCHDAKEQSRLMRAAMLSMLEAQRLIMPKNGRAIDADGAREMLREARALSARSLRALKSADAALTTVLAWERTYYAPEEKAAMRDVEIARRKIRRLMKPGQFVEDESAAGDESERDQHLTDQKTASVTL